MEGWGVISAGPGFTPMGYESHRPPGSWEDLGVCGTLQFNEMPPTVFISYSHEDEVWKDRLLKHLAILKPHGRIEVWDDRKIRGGDEWPAEIWRAMDAAHVAVLLVSVNSLASEFIMEKEVPYLLGRRKKDGIVIFPILCTDCLWSHFPRLSDLQMFPRDSRALADFRGNPLQTELKKIAQEILEIALNGSQPSVTPKTANSLAGTTLPALHQLPAPPADFTGREEDLEVLRSALTQGGTGGIFGLRGSGGVGKTTLALKLAEELAPRYPDAQLYLDLKGVDPQPLTAAQAMAHVLRSFHPEASLPENETDLASLYRSVLFGKRTLLLMDNAASREQVEPLPPPSGSLLLVTSRFHFTLPGIVTRDLDEMSPEDARALLLKLAPRIGNESDEIARLCGRLPLALRLAGSALAERSYLSPSEYARRLREGQERLDPVEASLNLSYELLSADQKRLWRMLAIFPGTFAATAAAAVWELEIDPTQEALWGLVGCSLVEWEEKEKRYRLHDLARKFVDRKIEADERDATQRRHAKYYLEVLRNANGRYLQGGDAILLALRLFDTEWGNVQAGFTWSASRFLEDDEAARVCSAYPNAGSHLLSLRQHPQEHIRWGEPALAAARQRKAKALEGVHLGNLGLAYAALGEPRRAIEFYEQYLAIARDIGDRRAEGNALGSLGLAYEYLGEIHRAVEFHEQWLSIARDIGDRRGEGQALGNLGNAYAALGEPRRAIEFYEQVLATTRETGDRLSEAIASWNLGDEIEKEGDLARAADLMQVRVDFEREINHPDAEKHAARVQTLRAPIAEQSS